MASYVNIEIKDGEVYSSQYDDIYYSRDDGPAESEYVFLAGNHLPARWQGKRYYCIAETGFGTGLNFLVTLNAWQQDLRHCETLDYFAIEAYPLHAAQLKAIHAHWPDFAAHSAEMIKQYPDLTPGCHTLSFAAGRVRLHLVFETLKTALDTYNFNPHSWFLDGFSPAKNPSMWEKNALNTIALQSCSGTSLATFTAAGEVRRNLVAAGFEVSKRKGFGRKREMLCAYKPATKEAQYPLKHAPWFATPCLNSPPRTVAVIGAGIAGAQIAWHLAHQGVKVVVIEALEQVARAASGNQAGMLAPKLTASPSEEEAFYLAAFNYQLRQLNDLRQQGHNIGFIQHGLLQLAHNQSTQQRFERLARREDLPEGLFNIIDPKEVSYRLGEHTDKAGLLINKAGSLAPGSMCKALLDHPNIELKCSTSVTDLWLKDGRPTLKLSSAKILEVDALVLANGHQSTTFSDTIKITPVRGQTSSAHLPIDQVLSHALGHTGYMVTVPDDEQKVIFGATYVRGDENSDLRVSETDENTRALEACLPKFASHLSDIQSSHAAIRASTPDRWPIVGPLVNTDFYEKEYADIHLGKQYKTYPQARYQEGIYILSGLGSRGLTSAAYCANILSHLMLGYTAPAPRHILHALHPARFLIRRLRKGKNEST